MRMCFGPLLEFRSSPSWLEELFPRISVTCDWCRRCGARRCLRVVSRVANCQSPRGYGLVIAPLVPATCKGVTGVSADEPLVGASPQRGSAATAPFAKRKNWLFAFFRSTTLGGDLMAGLFLGEASEQPYPRRHRGLPLSLLSFLYLATNTIACIEI